MSTLNCPDSKPCQHGHPFPRRPAIDDLDETVALNGRDGRPNCQSRSNPSRFIATVLPVTSAIPTSASRGSDASWVAIRTADPPRPQ